MDFLYKLFPYKSLFQFDGNTLTAWWVVVIVAIFLFYVFRLLNVTRRLRRKLESLSKKFSEDLIKKDVLFSQVWKDYQESFIEFNGGKKTDEFSYDYFNEKHLLSANTNLRLINSIPATLVGFGILGTFIGLTYGISNFQTSSTEQIKDSIETLLSGMGTAFVSSIYGMLLSLVFTFFEKIQVNSLHNSIHILCYKLDKKFKISKEDERTIELKRQERLLNEYFIFKDENGNDIKPGNVFRDIFIETRKQSVALQSFSTDLANLIEAGFEKILNDPDKGVMFELQSLKTEIVNLGSKLQDPASEMTQNVVKELETSMAKMIEEFKVSMSGSTKSELENLTTLLGQAGSSLTDFPSKLELMTDNLNQNFKGLQEVVQQISQQTLLQSEQSTEQMRKQVEEMGEILKDKVGDLQVGQEVLMTKQTENLQVSEKLLGSFNSSIERLNELSKQVNETVSSFSKVQGELNSASGQLKSITDNVLSSSNSFKEAQLKFAQHSNEFLKNNASTIEEIQKSLQKAERLSSDYANKFEIIEKGLKNIFEELDKGLKGYQENVEVSTASYLEKYSKALTDTASALGKSFDKLDPVLDEINESLAEIKNNRR
ncbi:MotA/TolQ/ExbB proton channel family protein [Pleomorphovibrio marinus]|uniref:MotA/TolQ/ExbB proton channel family protein n=1 Tax=Pleomorphovibrio marinus TaxID=2164132 RepID=UPI000E0C29CB|nr:MotA/TolQ/ExbB proton channel family protein [Pleomorphovibrio marinus]